MSVVYTMETIILPRGLLMVHSGSLTFQKTNNIPNTGNYFLEFILLLIVFIIGVVIYVTVSFRRNLKPNIKPAKIKKFTEFQSNAKVKKEIAPASVKPIAKVKNSAPKNNADKSPIRTSNKKRSSVAPSQSTSTPAAPTKKKASRLTYPHHPLLKNVCQRDTADDNKSSGVEIMPIRKAPETKGPRKSDSSESKKTKTKNTPPPKDVEPVVKEVAKKRTSSSKKKEDREKVQAPVVLEPPHFMMPEYTKAEKEYIDALSQYVIPYVSLPECGYPYIISDKTTCAVFLQGTSPKRFRTDADVSASSSDDSSSDSNSSSESLDDLLKKKMDEHRCARCRTKFHTLKNGRCLYHFGRPLKYGGVDCYTCCGGDRKSPGCTMAPLHVWTGVRPGVNGPMDGYAVTVPSYSRRHRVVALDCEMCFTPKGLELSRVTVLDLRGDVIYDTLVMPDNPIVDYNTRFSGLSEESFQNAPVATLKEVQETILELIDYFTIVIGHGLENDFRALKIVHHTVVDTAIIFREVMYDGEWRRHSLRNLCKWHLNRDIQNDAEGHSSLEDASSCLDLMRNLIGNLYYVGK